MLCKDTWPTWKGKDAKSGVGMFLFLAGNSIRNLKENSIYDLSVFLY